MGKRYSFFILFLSFIFLTECSGPKTDSEKVEFLLKQSSKLSRKHQWNELFMLYSKNSSIKLELFLKSLFQVLLQTPKFSSDELLKHRANEIYQGEHQFRNLSGQEYFNKAFSLLEKYPDYLNQFQSNLKIYETYDIIEIRILKDKAYILIKTPQNQKEAVFFLKEGTEWKIDLVNDTERFA